MKISVLGTDFRFSFFSIVLYIALLIFLVSLGFWQLSRAEEKEALLLEQHVSGSKKVIKLSSLLDLDLDNIRYRKTVITGEYDLKHQFLIDNQIYKGQAGYFVMTPYKIKGLKKAVLVNRGWVPLTKDRRILPDVTINKSMPVLKGRINNFPVVGIRLEGAEIPTEGWPSVVQVVDSPILSKKTGYTLLPFQLELNTEMAEGYTRDWKRRSVMPPEKHIAYAVQWFGLAITLTILFIWFSKKVK